MNKVYPHFFMEVLVKKLHSTVDKFAKLDKSNDTITYTTKAAPKDRKVIDLAEGQRIFEDLHGAIAERWVATPEFVKLQARKLKAQARRASRKQGVA